MTESHDRLVRAQRADERGMVVAWLAIMIVLFIGVAAFAVDVAYWHLTQGREQKAADAAALAGAVTYPGDPVKSDAAANDVVNNNGYAVGSVQSIAAGASCPLGAGNTTNVCGGPGDHSYQYKVTVASKVNNLFGNIFGIGTTTVRASATAEYLKPLQMGSPQPQFGNDPDATPSWPIGNPPPSTYPNFWANINGAGTAKQQGDAYAADWCDRNNSNQLVTDGCSAPGDGNNTDFKPEGYYYAVDFTGSGTVNLQAFDPAFVNVGQFCYEPPRQGQVDPHLDDAAALANIPGYPEAGVPGDIQKRFRPVPNGVTSPSDPGFQYCSGDNSFQNSAGQSPPPNTTYTVTKATVPGEPNTAQPVPGCSPIMYPGFSGDVSVPLQSGAIPPGAPTQFAKYFRQWVTLCSVTGAPGDEFFIQVSTDSGSGSNHFALRGETSGNNTGLVTIAGNTYMGIYANVGSQQDTNFYVVRIPSAAKGHTLVLNFYDIGDADSEGSLTIKPPLDSNIGNGSAFADGACKWTGDGTDGAKGYSANTANAPWGDLTGINGCAITGVNRQNGSIWNAQWSTVTIPIPADYTCDDGSVNGCWITIDYQFAGPVHDVTSWNAFLLGDPVRLTK